MMNSESLKAQWERRLAVARRIAKTPDEFKECDQCRAITPRYYALCPFCHCYRFVEDVDSLRATLEAMVKSPWPFGAPVVPRLADTQGSGPTLHPPWNTRHQ